MAMLEIPEDRCEREKLFTAIDYAFKAGDFQALGHALGDSPRWFDEVMPFELGLGHPLEYAIYWSPVEFIRKLLKAGSNANYVADTGFPSLIAALSTDRLEKHAIVQLLLEFGADPSQRGINDWTPLHYAANRAEPDSLELLLRAGANPKLRTRIDDCETAAEEADRLGFSDIATMLNNYQSNKA
jgi:ankyrin repeat protein